jgi:uracil-DNA glycosylase
MPAATIPAQLPDSWKQVIGSEFAKPYMQSLGEFLHQEKHRQRVIYPAGKEIFNAFELTDFERVKVVILGQDPYHGPNQAHGLCFSVKPGVPTPPSLLNIFKEIDTDLGLERPTHGCLLHWARQGVLLLNAVLTVEKSKAGSHQGKGWETFTDAVIDSLNRQRQGVVFLLWGSYAQKKGRLIDSNRHYVLQSPHPSPLSAYRGFFGCHHFSRANDYLASNSQTPIDWSLPKSS